MISYKGKLGLTAAFPLLLQLIGAIDIAGLQAEVAALLQASVTFTPPSIVGVLSIVAALGAAIQAGFQPPAFDFKANLLLKYGLLKARLELLLKIKDVVFGGSVRLYEYEGQAGTFGSDLGASIAGPAVDGGITPTQQTFAVVLLAEGGTAGETTLKALRGGV